MREKHYKWAEYWLMYPEDAVNCKNDDEKHENGMGIREDVDINFPLPMDVQADVEALFECYEIGAWYSWDNIVSALDVDSKVAIEQGKLSWFQCRMLLKKFCA